MKRIILKSKKNSWKKSTFEGYFILAILLAAAGPFFYSSYLNANSTPDGMGLTSSEERFVNKRVAEYCESGIVEKAEPTLIVQPLELQVPVLVYHSVTDKGQPSLDLIRPLLFRQQIKLLKESGYQSVSVDQLTNYMNGRGALPSKPVIVTFDDGWKDNFESAKYLKELDFGATFYIISNAFADPQYMSEQDIISLSQNPKFEIGSHSHTHFMKWESKLNTLPLCTMATEMLTSKLILERLTKKPITSIAWPFNYYTKEAVFVASKLGYTSTMLIDPMTTNALGNSPLFMNRLVVDGSCGIAEFQEMLNTKVTKECS